MKEALENISHVANVESVFHFRAPCVPIWTFIQLNTSAQNVANVVIAPVRWQYTGKVIRERNRLNVLFATDSLPYQVTLLLTPEFIVGRNRTNVTFVTRRSAGLKMSKLTCEFIRETNHLNVLFVANDSHGQVALSLTAEFTAETNRTNVTCVTRHSASPEI